MVKQMLDTKQIQEKLKLFEAIVDHSQEGTVVFNDQFEAIFANKTFGEMVLMDPKDIRGLELSKFIPQTKRLNHEKLVRSFKNSDKERQNLFEWRSIQCNRSDDTLFPARIIINKSFILNNLIFIVSLQDMTQVHSFEEQKIEAELAQFQAEQQRRFIAKTLQVKLENAFQTLGTQAMKIKDVLERKQIQSSISEIRNKVDTAFKISHPSVSLKKQNSHVGRSLFGIIEGIRFILEPLAKEKAISLSWDIPDIARNCVLRDHQTIGEILYNVIDDAIGNASAGKIKFEIMQMHEDTDNHMLIDIVCSSSRFGVEQKIINMVLNAASLSDVSEGVGLKYDGMCLRMAKYLTEKINGHFRVASHPIEGTEIFIKLRTALL